MTPPPSFDGLAPYYHLLERITFGHWLHWCRTAHLDRLCDRGRALVLGDGDGRFLADLLRANLAVRVDSIDLSPRMISLARKRLADVPGAVNRVRFWTGDARTIAFPARDYDLVVTNFFLDCFESEELAGLIARITEVCVPRGLWLDGDFRSPKRGWPRIIGGAMLAGMYRAFAILSRLRTRALIDPAPFLEKNGFGLVGEEARCRGFLSSRLWLRGMS